MAARCKPWVMEGGGQALMRVSMIPMVVHVTVSSCTMHAFGVHGNIHSVQHVCTGVPQHS